MYVSFAIVKSIYKLLQYIYWVSEKKRPAFERLLLPEYISNDILQCLIK